MTATSEHPVITAAELQATREFLGLSISWIAEKLVISERRIQRMETGAETVPIAIATLIDDIYAETRDLVGDLSATYRRRIKSDEDPQLLTYRTDKDYTAQGGKYPARWHRQVCMRVADACPGVILTYDA